MNRRGKVRLAQNSRRPLHNNHRAPRRTIPGTRANHNTTIPADHGAHPRVMFCGGVSGDGGRGKARLALTWDYLGILINTFSPNLIKFIGRLTRV